jgi:hypothetical protein
MSKAKQTRSSKKDVPPAPKGVAAINLDSNYANPTGPATLRANKGSDGIPSVPSCGGTVRAGKDSTDCNDSLGNPARHHGEASQAVVVSGRGPAAAARQHSTGRRTGINSMTKDDYAKDSAVEDMNPGEKRSTHRS